MDKRVAKCPCCNKEIKYSKKDITHHWVDEESDDGNVITQWEDIVTCPHCKEEVIVDYCY